MVMRLLLIFLLIAQPVLAQLPIAKAESVSVSATRLAEMDSVISAEIDNRRLPGAVVFVGRKGRIVWHKSYGARTVRGDRGEGADRRSQFW